VRSRDGTGRTVEELQHDVHGRAHEDLGTPLTDRSSCRRMSGSWRASLAMASRQCCTAPTFRGLATSEASVTRPDRTPVRRLSAPLRELPPHQAARRRAERLTPDLSKPMPASTAGQGDRAHDQRRDSGSGVRNSSSVVTVRVQAQLPLSQPS
jgi:hypothetical protein